MTVSRPTSFAAGLAIVFVAFGAVVWGEPPIAEVPDPDLTPGKVATQSEQEICAVGKASTYSQQHRQTTAETKREVFKRYGMAVPTGRERVTWEIDHLVPLCLGGADDIRNLWPQPDEHHHVTFNYHDKDKLEAELCRAVCRDHSIKASVAQSYLLNGADWRRAYCDMFSDDRCQQTRSLP